MPVDLKIVWYCLSSIVRALQVRTNYAEKMIT